METLEALHAYFCLMLACGVLSLTVSASVHPGAREDVMGQYRLTNRQQCHRLCWYRALCGSYSYHTESSAPLMDMSTSPPNCVLHAQNDSENCLCSVCVLYTQHDRENCLCSACLCSVDLCCLCSAHTTCPCFILSAFCLHPHTPLPLARCTGLPLPSYCTLHPTRAAVHLPHHLFQLLLFH